MSTRDQLAACGLFAGLSSEQLSHVEAFGAPRRAAQGEVIFRADEEARNIYVVLSGKVELTLPLRVMGEVKDVRFQTVEAGGVIAWSALVPPHKLTMSARATSGCELVGFSRESLLLCFEENPRTGYIVMRNLAPVVGARLHEATVLWIRGIQKNVEERYG